MYLKELKLSSFKNCKSAELSLSEKINCFVGLNAAGKTNILDSIYYLAFCKSYFSSLSTNSHIRDVSGIKSLDITSTCSKKS